MVRKGLKRVVALILAATLMMDTFGIGGAMQTSAQEAEDVAAQENTTADVVAVITTASGATYNQSYTGIAVDGDLYYCFTVENAFIDIQ